jgi:hypothetical protein
LALENEFRILNHNKKIIEVLDNIKILKVRPSTKCVTPTNGHHEGATD